MPTVAIIPARGGSRGLAGKHLRLLGGEPLLAHTVRAGLAARRIDRVLVSTDDPRIRSAALRLGAEAPFLRPAELAADEAPTMPVIAHAVDWLEATGLAVDVVVTLQATTPLRAPDEIDAVVALLDDAQVQSAVTVTWLAWPASVVGWLDDDGALRLMLPEPRDARRQASAPAVRITGGVYATRRELLRRGRLLDDRPAAHLVDAATAIDIDTAADLVAARRAWRTRVGMDG
jgi:CMP-N-acetylneuraminic acid synthetase